MVQREWRVAEGVVRQVAFQALEEICHRHGLHLFEGDPERCTEGDDLPRRL